MKNLPQKMPCDPHLKRLLKAQVSHKFSRRNRKKKFARKGSETWRNQTLSQNRQTDHLEHILQTNPVLYIK